jgi:hypothetical protein
LPLQSPGSTIEKAETFDHSLNKYHAVQKVVVVEIGKRFFLIFDKKLKKKINNLPSQERW